MLKPAVITVLILSLTSHLHAQDRATTERVITTDSTPSTAELHQWLDSGSPRLVAWAGYFARVNNDATILSEIPALLAHWPEPPVLTTTVRGQSMFAQQSLLDAVIQRNTDVPLSTITAFAPEYPIQAAILVSRKPLSETSFQLDQWYRSGGDPWQGRTLARIAAMMLAKSPPSSFIADVLSRAEEKLTISVRLESGGYGIGLGAGCGDSIGMGVPNGWPPISAYMAEENNQNSSGPILVQVGDDRIAYTRYSAFGGSGSCYGVQPLNAQTRHRLISYWLATSPRDMSWHAEEFHTIVWTSQEQYLHDLAVEVETQRALLRATVESLRAAKLLNANDADAAQPQLTLVIRCDAKPCPLPGTSQTAP